MLVGLSVCQTAAASLCPLPSFVYDPDSFVSTPGAPVTAEADSVQSDDGVVMLEGNTVIEYLGRKLTAQNALYNQNTGELSVEGALNFTGQGFQLESNDAFIDLDDDKFSTGRSDYQLDINGKRASGSADVMEGSPNGDFTLKEATYSTCPPGDKSWFVKADSLELFPSEGIGTARNLRLVFKGVPILALPYFSFPISDKRKTGFLAPILARNDNTGLELLLPWYWNIRPDLDATFTPRFTSRRGVQLQSEFRYLNKQGIWVLDYEFLKDRALNNESRSFVQLKQNGRFNPELTSEIVASRVSDTDYLDDLGNSLELASISHLEQRADIRLDRDNLQALLRVQGFQTIDTENIAPADRPHARLPQFKVESQADDLPLGIRADLASEFVFFNRNESDAVTGLRLDFQPRVQLPLAGDAWFIRPSASYRFTYYSLSNSGEEIQSDTSRNTGTFSIDSGLFFDRTLSDNKSIQTLEPRLFYLRVPFVDQSGIPLFDSSEFDFNISQLFRENRFSGADRVADANQLSVALTTRTIDGADGSERFRASIGQIRFFEDRRVTLETDGVAETRDTSDFVAEVATSLSRTWFGKGNIQWNLDENRTVRSSLTLGYRPDDDHIVNFSHRLVGTENSDEPRTEQIDVSALWRLNPAWRIAARWNYSLDSDQSIESLLGVEFDSCCWAVRFAARRYIADNGEDNDVGIFLQLVLKGLAPLGQNYGALIENAVSGYKDTIE